MTIDALLVLTFNFLDFIFFVFHFPVGSNGYDPVALRGVIASAVPRNHRPLSGPLHAGPVIMSGARILRRQGATTSRRSSLPVPPPNQNYAPNGHIDPWQQQQQQQPSPFDRENPAYAQLMYSPEYPYPSQQESQHYHRQEMSEQEQWEREQELRYQQENSFEANWGAQQSTSVASVLARRQSSAGLDRFRNRKRPAAEISLSPPPRNPPISTLTLPPDDWRHLAVDNLSDVGSPGRDNRWIDNDLSHNRVMMAPDFGSLHDNSFGLNNNPRRMQPPNSRHPLQGLAQFQHPGQFPPPRTGPLQGFQQPPLPMDLSQHSRQPPRGAPFPGIGRFRQTPVEPTVPTTTMNAPNIFSFQQNPQAPQQRRDPIPGISRFRNEQVSTDQAVTNPPNQFSLDPPTPRNGAFPGPPNVAHSSGRTDFFRPDLRDGLQRFQTQAQNDYPGTSGVDAGSVAQFQGFSEPMSEMFSVDGNAHNAQFQGMSEPSPGMDTGGGIPLFQGMSEPAPGMVSGGGGIAKFQFHSSPAAPAVPQVSPTEPQTTPEDLAGGTSYPPERSSADTTSLVPPPDPAVEAASAAGPSQAENKSVPAVTAQAPQQENSPLQFQTYRAPPQSNTLPRQPASTCPPVQNSAKKSTRTSSPQTRQSTTLPYQTPLAAAYRAPETPSNEEVLLSDNSENIYSPPTQSNPPLDRNIPEIKFFLGELQVDQRGTPFGSNEASLKQDKEVQLPVAPEDSRDDASQSSSKKSDRKAPRILHERRNETIWRRRPVGSSKDEESRQDTPEKKPAAISYNAWKESSNSGSDSDDDSWEEIEKELKNRKSLWRG